MAELSARGPKPNQHLRKTLTPGEVWILGRADSADSVAVPWDDRISKRHAELRWHNGVLEVKRLPEAKNAIFFRERPQNEFRIKIGDRFVIGETRFYVSQGQESSRMVEPAEVAGFTVGVEELKQIKFRNADHRIDALSRLPEAIASASDDNQLADRLVTLLLEGVPRAGVAAVVTADERSRKIETVRFDSRMDYSGRFLPSQRLVWECVRNRKCAYHSWKGGSGDGDSVFTASDSLGWAFAAPVEDPSGIWRCLYVGGSRVGEHDEREAREDIKFAGLVASILEALLRVGGLQRRQAMLGQCFSPVLLRALEGNDPEEILKPQLADITVLFCDMRGFAKISEASENLFSLLERTGRALGVMTEHILKEGGVIGDFQGDAALGFGGWPRLAKSRRGAEVAQACRAALEIRKQFAATADEQDHPLHGFKVGIGIATGRAVAGRIGTTDQAKFSVFGPVVNLASRLEGMTKIFRAPILLDERTAALAQQQLGPSEARYRRLAQVIPMGMKSRITVTELLPPYNAEDQLTDDHIRIYESGLDALSRGLWPEAYRLLSLVPQEDRAKDYLTGLILSHYREAPEDWDGVIIMRTKS